ncbi:LacI family DNA-binding transcriptional regulator [Micromonospora krabiensis]|uniref:Transcriptional regulator, LacI family n=1 Tax=Micromonospora krabiensis TaxID=307121 RepID=A0A1C3MYL9_9ACTN|nr:LacI family DNA-binding transcriptional regulator [Micromonospora krabiensis]SBV25432.1 transcriptional regulator, LacI family [Micromonospora krabiensis]
MTGSVTLHDVARRAGVSLATASRALNGSANRVVGEQLRERVLRAAAELRYSPNAHAQAMARGRTDVVGLSLHDIADPYFSAVAAGVMREAGANGLLVTMASTQRRPGAETDYVGAFRRHWASVVIVVGSRTDDRAATDRLADELAAFEAEGGRAVAVSQPRLPVDTISIDNHGGARDLGEALHDLGHRRFAVLGGPGDLLTASERVAGFRAALSRRGGRLDPDHVVSGPFTRDGGYDAMHRLLDREPDVTCVFAVNDVMAVGAMAAMRDRGLEPPAGMAVAGFDDIATLRDVNPGLTTVRIPLEEIGALAVRLALEDDVARPRVRRVGGEVVLRASTPRVPS